MTAIAPRTGNRQINPCIEGAVQYLDPRLNFGEVRQVLRRFVGVIPSYQEAVRDGKGREAARPVAERWARRPVCGADRMPGLI